MHWYIDMKAFALIALLALSIGSAEAQQLGGAVNGAYLLGTKLGVAGTPTVASNACGSTSQGAITAGSTDWQGKITAGTTSVTACAVTFANTRSYTPTCNLTPANATAAAVNTVQAYVSATSTTGFTITGLALDGAAFFYLCE